MVNVIRRTPEQPKRSFGQEILGNLERASQAYQQHQQNKLSAQSDERLAREHGIDLSGITNPEERKVILQNALQGENQQKLEILRQGGKQGLAEKKQSFLEKLFGGNQQQGQQSGQNQSSQGFIPSQISDADIAQATSLDPALGRELRAAKDTALREERKTSETEKRNFESERAFHTGYSKNYVEKADKIRENLPKQEQALEYARNAIESGEVGAFSVNALADSIGGVVGDALRNKSGAQLTLAAKEQLLPTLSRISAKAQNQYMEKRISSMIPKAGQTEEANLSMQEMLEAESAMDKAYLQEFDRLSLEDDKNFGYERKDIDKRAHDAVKPIQKHIVQRTTFRLKELEEQEKGLSDLRKDIGKNVVKGTPLTMAMAKLYSDKFGKEAIKVAEKNGYYIPTADEFMSYQKRPEEFREGFE